MSTRWRTLIRLCAVAAVLAGILRGLSSVIPATSPRIMLFYLATVGTLILIARDVGIFGESLYPVGALMFAVGLDLA